ncbi:MAG: PRD domain-containing protein, partial [Coprobacillus sp.]
THLKFFGLRVFNQTKHVQDESLNNDLLEIMKEKYVQPYLCVLDIQRLIENKYQYYLEDEEILFLTIHVAKIISNK